MALDFMSQQAFDAGGPQGSAAGSAAGGFGQLAQVLAQGPKLHAQAAYVMAETDKARAETQGLTADQAIKQGVIQRQQEGIALASDPNTARDPAKMQRLYAIGLADPTIAPHLNSVLGATLALAALNGTRTQREADAFASSTGVAPFGNTSTGAAQEQANQRTLEAQRQTGATGRTVLEQQGQNYRAPQSVVPAGSPPGTAPVLTSLADVYAHPSTPISPAQQQAEAAPIPTVPAGSPPGTQPTLAPSGAAAAAPGTRTPISAQQQQDAQTLVPVVPAGSPAGTPPVMMTKGQVAASNGKFTEIGPQQQQAEAAPTTVVTPQGPRLRGTGTATAEGATPAMTSPEAAWTGTVYQPSLTAPGGLSDVIGGRGGISGQGPVDLTQPQFDAQGQPTQTSPLATAMVNRPPQQQTVAPVVANSEESMRFNQLMDQVAGTHYPGKSGFLGMGGGTSGTWGPAERTAIEARARQLMNTPQYRGQTGNAIEAAIRELQTTGTPDGQVLPPDARQGVAVGGNIIRFQPKTGNTVKTDTTSTKKATTTQTAEATGTSSDGRRVGKFGGQWFYMGGDGQPTTPYVAGNK